MEVRDATERDIPVIREYLQAYVNEFWNRPFPQPEFSTDYLATGKVIVAQEGEDVIGIAKGVLARGTGHVSFIYVRSSERRRGEGTRLLRALCEWFSEHHIVDVTLGVDTSNPNGLAFWEELGFREFHRELATPLRALERRLDSRGRP
jgi:ribosomal protein S18 acetylase RimI-like enzyme